MTIPGTTNTSEFEGEILKKVKIALKILFIIILFVVGFTPFVLLVATRNMLWLFLYAVSPLTYWVALITVMDLVIEWLKD